MAFLAFLPLRRDGMPILGPNFQPPVIRIPDSEVDDAVQTGNAECVRLGDRLGIWFPAHNRMPKMDLENESESDFEFPSDDELARPSGANRDIYANNLAFTFTRRVRPKTNTLTRPVFEVRSSAV